MSNIVTIGFITEGPTDIRFLRPIIKRTFEEIAFECKGEIEVFDPVYVDSGIGPFSERVLNAAKNAEKNGLMVLCVHTDSDNKRDAQVFNNKIIPAFREVNNSAEEICKNLIAIVPIQMTEAWMLADKQLFKEEIGTTKTDVELGIDKRPENYSDPKSVLKTAISIALKDESKRRRNLDLGELYLPIGQKLSIDCLLNLPSYNKFSLAVRNAFVKLNYLY